MEVRPKTGEEAKPKQKKDEHNTVNTQAHTAHKKTIWYTNADQLLNKLDELSTRINTSDSKPTIVAITEVNPKNSRFAIQLPELKITSYQEPIYNPKGRGICLYVHEGYEITTIQQGNHYQAVEVKVSKQETVKLYCFYRSPSSSDEENTRFNDELHKVANDATGNIIITGDFNLPNTEWNTMYSNNKAENECVEVMKNCFLKQHVTIPTRHRAGQTSNILDLILTLDANLVDTITSEPPVGASDHVLLIVNVNCTIDEPITIGTRLKLEKGDYTKMRKMMDQDWDEKMRHLSTNEAWDLFQSEMNKAIQQCIPKSKANGNPANKKPMWMSTRALIKVRKKHKAWQRYMETREGSAYKAYARARNQARNEVRRAIKKFEQSIANDIKSNPKKFWAYTNSKLKSRREIPQLEKTDGSKTENDNDKAATLNKFFVSVFTEEDVSTLPQLPPIDVDTLLSDIVISDEDVKKKMKLLKPGKSPGLDNMYPRILKELDRTIVTPLRIIFQKSLQESVVPEVWREAMIVPIHKNGSRSSPGNYRPISLTSIVCKMMESIIRDSIMEHMHRNQLFSDDQHGFLPGKSCTTQLLEVLDSWMLSMDNHSGIDAVYLDFAKAFDTVPHQRLQVKMRRYGIGGKVHKWISSFLSDRKQLVKVNGTRSDWAAITSGIPQGSVLGPVLFIIYINDLPETLHCQCKMFADDTKIWKQIATPQDTIELQDDINALQDWSDKWLLKFNTSKCKVLRVGPQRIETKYTMGDKGDTLMETTVERDLGVWIDGNLTFREHILKTAKRANMMLGIIRRTFKSLDAKNLPPLYKTLVRSMLEYGNTAWSPQYRKEAMELENVQRRATRMIPDLKGKGYSDRLKALDLPTLAFRRLRGDMINTFKYAKRMYSSNLLRFEASDERITRGHQYKLSKKRSNTAKHQSFFTNRITDTWNSLPSEVVEVETVNQFKNKIDRYWKTHPLRYNPQADVKMMPERFSEDYVAH